MWYIYPWPQFLQFIEPPTASGYRWSLLLVLSSWMWPVWPPHLMGKRLGPRSEKNWKNWKMYWEGWDEKWMKVSIHVAYGWICQSRLGWDSLIFMLRGFGDVAMVFAMMPWFLMGISKITSARSSTWNENAGNPKRKKKTTTKHWISIHPSNPSLSAEIHPNLPHENSWGLSHYFMWYPSSRYSFSSYMGELFV